ncbi:MAG: hypothetical protein WCH34_18805, partial [Bacteroidota bacterium]
ISVFNSCLFIFLLMSASVFSQKTFNAPEKNNDDKKKKVKKEKQVRFNGWRVGGEIGAYIPTGNSANYFNGSPGNENNIQYVLSNYTWYNEIKTNLVNQQVLNSNDTFFVADYPTNMKYKVAMNLGVFARYAFSDNEIFFEGNYSKLTATDVFSVGVVPPTYLTFKQVFLYPVWGSLNLININIGYSRLFGKSWSALQYYIEAGVNINNTKIKESKITIESHDYNIINVYGNQTYIPGNSLQEVPPNEGGLGFGIFAGGGIKLNLSPVISIEPGVNMYWNKYNLLGYKEFDLKFNAFIRLSYKLTSDL